MKHEKLSQALNEVDDRYIAKAAGKKRRSYAPWFGAVAAILAVAIFVGVLWRPDQSPVASLDDPSPESQEQTLVVDPTDLLPPVAVNTIKYQLAAPVYPVMVARPGDDYDYEAYMQWRESVKAIHDQPKGYADTLDGYFETVLPALLADEGNTNPVCSPVNIYMALAMLAETTGGESRQQLLDFLGVQSIEALRKQAGQVWNAHYWDDGVTTSILGNSLWLDEGFAFDQECADALAQYYYAASFSGKLGTDEMNAALQDWLNTQTGGLLEEQAKNVELSPETAFALASTIYYKAAWSDEFNEARNTEETFYGRDQEVTATFMNSTDNGGVYYRGEGFGAVNLRLQDGSRMWFVLPDEGVEAQSIVADAWNMISTDPNQYAKQVKLNLSVPKFKTEAAMELKQTLYDLGLDKVMGDWADFGGLSDVDDLAVSSVSHAATVEIDEGGVVAAAFTVISVAESAMPDELEELDFVLDRPFVYFIESSDGLPLFAGVVNQI